MIIIRKLRPRRIIVRNSENKLNHNNDSNKTSNNATQWNHRAIIIINMNKYTK